MSEKSLNKLMLKSEEQGLLEAKVEILKASNKIDDIIAKVRSKLKMVV